MANIEPTDEQLLQSALEHPFEPAEVPIKPVQPPTVPSKGPIPNGSAPHAPSDPATPPEPVEEDPWKAEFEAQLSEWRAMSSEARQKAERERAKWEEVRKHEEDERLAVGQEPESWESLGAHITTSIAAASEILEGSTASLVSSAEGAELSGSRDSAPQFTAMESASPSQKWENIPSSPESSFPSISLPDPSTLSSPSPQPDPLPPPYKNGEPSKSSADAKNPHDPPSTIPSITNHAISRRTRMSLILSSLAINLLLPFVNGVMLGFGEIFAKNVLIGWFGWKLQRGRTAATVGLR